MVNMPLDMFETVSDPFALVCSIVAGVALIAFIGYMIFGGLSEDDPLDYVLNLLILIVIIFVSGSVAAAVPEEVTNTAEIQSTIQQEYGISVSEQTVQTMYDSTHSDEQGPWFAEDISGMVHEYTIINDKIIFIQP